MPKKDPFEDGHPQHHHYDLPHPLGIYGPQAAKKGKPPEPEVVKTKPIVLQVSKFPGHDHEDKDYGRDDHFALQAHLADCHKEHKTLKRRATLGWHDLTDLHARFHGETVLTASVGSAEDLIAALGAQRDGADLEEEADPVFPGPGEAAPEHFGIHGTQHGHFESGPSYADFAAAGQHYQPEVPLTALHEPGKNQWYSGYGKQAAQAKMDALIPPPGTWGGGPVIPGSYVSGEQYSPPVLDTSGWAIAAPAGAGPGPAPQALLFTDVSAMSLEGLEEAAVLDAAASLGKPPAQLKVWGTSTVHQTPPTCIEAVHTGRVKEAIEAGHALYGEVPVGWFPPKPYDFAAHVQTALGKHKPAAPKLAVTVKDSTFFRNAVVALAAELGVPDPASLPTASLLGACRAYAEELNHSLNALLANAPGPQLATGPDPEGDTSSVPDLLAYSSSGPPQFATGGPVLPPAQPPEPQHPSGEQTWGYAMAELQNAGPLDYDEASALLQQAVLTGSATFTAPDGSWWVTAVFTKASAAWLLSWTTVPKTYIAHLAADPSVLTDRMPVSADRDLTWHQARDTLIAAGVGLTGKQASQHLTLAGQGKTVELGVVRISYVPATGHYDLTWFDLPPVDGNAPGPPEMAAPKASAPKPVPPEPAQVTLHFDPHALVYTHAFPHPGQALDRPQAFFALCEHGGGTVFTADEAEQLLDKAKEVNTKPGSAGRAVVTGVVAISYLPATGQYGLSWHPGAKQAL